MQTASEGQQHPYTSLQDMGSKLFLTHVPIWAWPKKTSRRLDPTADFVRRFLLMKLFQSAPLRGEQTTQEEFRAAPVPEILQNIEGRALGGLPFHNQVAKLYGCATKDLRKKKAPPLTLHPWVAEWKRELHSSKGYNPGQRVRSAQEFLNWLGVFAEFHGQSGEQLDLYKVRFEHLKSYLQWLARRVKVGALAQNSAYGKSVDVLQFARYVRTRYGTQNWVRNLQCIPQNTEPIDYWIPGRTERAAFFRIVLNFSDVPARDFALFGLMYLNGLRTGETLGLRWVDINEDQKQITIHEKGGTYAHIPLFPPTQQALRRWRREQTADSECVFTTKDGKSPIHTWYVGSRMLAFALAADWPVNELIRPYTWRHTFVTVLLQHTRDYLLVRNLARHKTQWMTTRYYHVQAQTLKQAGGQIQRYMRAYPQKNDKGVHHNAPSNAGTHH